MFKVNFEQVGTAGLDITNGANIIEQHLADMDKALAPLRSDWSGAASEAYQISQRNWNQAIADMKVLLAQIGTQVGRDNEQFGNTEHANEKRFV
ncbi:WXG100 family type VII secretion target [Microbacterium sediminis]|uniref:ESAT-6-like protein n=1 Tax=Microbacterium sediminis TaxID=904291 RepID=A0A1B9NE34_9MICO|nr:WXG100 family type VII secretion target [Microbacterium sediminis]OCG74814.1 hypothetical protein A7J15_04665 [Microbacterium sediminis]QBR75115.1 WXG100 family type VII secretion target [Microbacterium sediminis]